MTVAIDTEAVIPYIGNDLANVFPISFPTFEAETIEAQMFDGISVYTDLVLGVDFSLANLGFRGVDGQLTLIDNSQVWLMAGKLKTGYTLFIKFRATGFQPYKGRDWGAFAPERFESTLDRFGMAILAVKAIALQLVTSVQVQIQNLSNATDSEVLNLQTQINSIDARVDALEAGGGSATVEVQAMNFTAMYNKIYFVTGMVDVQLPTPVLNKSLTVKRMGMGTVTLIRFGSELLDGVASNKTLTSTKQSVTLISDGTDWYII